MTALQELAQVKGELERIQAESGLNAQAATDASNALSEAVAQRDALAADRAALAQERDTLAAQVTALAADMSALAATVESRAAALAAQQLAAVGAAPVTHAANGAQSREEILTAYKSADAKGKRELFLRHPAIFNLR